MTVANVLRRKTCRASVSDASPSWRMGWASGTDALQKLLQPYLLGVLGLNPAAQVIRQRSVHPITARAQDLNFAASRQCENAVGGIRCGEARLDVRSRHDSEGASVASVVERVNRPHSCSAQQQAQDR